MPMLILVLAGCGDGLLSGDALAELSDIPPLPTEPAWSLRWLIDDDEGLLAECSLIALEDVAPELTMGRVYAEPPEFYEPPVWIEEDAYRWALGLLVLVNPEQVDPDEVAEAEELADEPGAWGAVDSRALLLGEGDLDALSEDLILDGDNGGLTEGSQWVGMLPELALARGSLAASLYPLPEEELLEQENEGVRVVSIPWLSGAAQMVFTGTGLGGLTAACDE